MYNRDQIVKNRKEKQSFSSLPYINDNNYTNDLLYNLN